ncbi:MAG TPA: glycoside hydrolase family 15 protein [Solirubrobacterales bacterium]|jgi:GH15 family glucan-1,4-alpha-glucosidase
MSAAAGTGRFPPIADYAFLSDCEVPALVAPSGAVEWLCLPRPDSPSVFGALLDRQAGSFTFAPDGVRVPSERRYLPGTLVLETTWQTPSGWAVVHDCLVMAPWHGARSERYRRAPADFTAEGMLLRTVRCIEGDVEMFLNCMPAFDYGRGSGRWEWSGTGYGDATVTPGSGGPALRLVTSLNLDLAPARAYAHTRLHEGEEAFAALSWRCDPPADTAEAFARSEETAHGWREWLKGGSIPDHPWRDHLEQSALTLKGLSYGPTGAVLAAATTSLPETPGGERNWDYRYSWIRDSAFMLAGLLRLGFHWEAFQYFAFVIEAVGGERLQIMYGVGGEHELHERTLDHLSGYDGARPVRIGNGAWDQRQHDVWGMLLDSVYINTRHRMFESLPEPAWERIAQLVEQAIENWREPDRGIWEIRGEPKHFTSSKVLCWVALDRGAKLAEQRGDAERAAAWRAVAEEIKADVLANGVDERGVFVQHYDGDALDASLLLIPLMEFLPGDDERVRATVLAIADELTEDGLVLRYRTHETDDGLSGEEGSFTICSFWLVSALAVIGEVGRARELCEKLLSFAGPLGLYAEEIDPRSGRHLGNYPQAFTHLSLIDAVSRLIAVERREEEAAL